MLDRGIHLDDQGEYRVSFEEEVYFFFRGL
jgi:hypothetical protein